MQVGHGEFGLVQVQTNGETSTCIIRRKIGTLARCLTSPFRHRSEARKKEFNIRIEKGDNVLEFRSSNIRPQQIETLVERLEAVLTR